MFNRQIFIQKAAEIPKPLIEKKKETIQVEKTSLSLNKNKKSFDERSLEKEDESQNRKKVKVSGIHNKLYNLQIIL